MTAKPRVLMVCHAHPGLVSGGTEVFSHNLFRALKANGRTHPMFLAGVTALHRPEPAGSRLRVIDGAAGDECLLWVGGFDRLMLAPTDAAPFVSAFSQLLLTFRPDIVHLHHFSLIGLEALAVIRRQLPNAGIVATLHDYHPICANDGLMLTTDTAALCRGASADACHACFPAIAAERFAARALHIRTMLDLVDRFIAPSRTLYDRFVAWGLPSDRIEMIGNAVADAERQPASDDDRSRTTFGYFGNITPHKGVLLALDAVDALAADGEAATLQLYGRLQFPTASFREAFTDAVARTDAACWHGAYDQADLPGLMRRVDWVVVPSTWWENAPLVILEAFRHGRPVICADVGGMAELVRHDVDGLHFRCGDAADLARTMRRAVREPGLWQRLASQVPPVRTLPEAAADHVALYRSLLRRRSARCA